MRIFKFSLTLFVVFFVLLFLSVKPARAISACSVNVSPRTISANGSSTLSFSVTNSDEFGEAAVWINLTSPSSDFTIGSGSADGWSAVNGGGNMVFENGNLAAGETQTFVLNITSGSSYVSNAGWSVDLSGSAGGGNPITCGGELGVTISAISISNITVSDIGENSALVSWTTNVSANSRLDWGTTNSYGSSANDLGTYGTSHSLSMTGLTNNTLYHIKVTSAAANGDSISSSDGTFTTAKSGTTTTVTITNTTTTTTTVTKIISDTTLPEVSLSNDFGKIYKVSPKFTGSASDNRGIAYVFYSLNDKDAWIPVDTISSAGSKNTTFSFGLGTLDDGNYKIKVRAEDTSGNVKNSKVYNLIIDRLPPQVGASIISIGGMSLSPDENGVIYTLSGFDQDITLSAVGGPVSINLTAGAETYPLAKNPDSGLWKGKLNFTGEGLYKLTANSVDGAGNHTVRNIGEIAVLSPGKIKSSKDVLPYSTVTVYTFDPEFRQFNIWRSPDDSQKNPQVTDKDGSYKLILPAGTYYIKIAKEGYKNLNTDLVTLDSVTPINSDFNLNANPVYKIGPFSLYLPVFFSDSVPLIPVNNKTAEFVGGEDVLIGKEFPGFNLNTTKEKIDNINLRGKPTVISFLNSWIPQTFSQINTLSAVSKNTDVNVLAIFPQESESAIKLLRARGGYDINMAADPDGILLVQTKVENLPVHFFLDRRGIVRSIKSGILNPDDLVNTLNK